MATDPVVTAQDVLRSVLRIRREGNQAVLQLLEELTQVQRQILDLAGKPAKARRLARQTETIALLLVLSLRQAQLRLWESQTGESLIERLEKPETGSDLPPPAPSA